MAISERAHNRRVEYSPPRLGRLGTLVELTQITGEGTIADIGDRVKKEGVAEKKDGLS